MKKKLVCLLLAFILVFAAMSFTACKEKEVEPTTTPDKQETDSGSEATPEPTATPEPEYGARLDTITIIGVEDNAAITQLEAGAIDIFAGPLDGENIAAVEESGLPYTASNGLYYELMLNNADTVEMAGTFNPFSVREIREAMNWLVDRDYIVQEIMDGAGTPRIYPIGEFSVDYSRYIEYARVTEANYTFDKDRAAKVIEDAMTAAGKEKNADGKWLHDGEPITLIFLIRSDCAVRQPMGDYVANLMEEIGFTVDRQYKVSADCWPLWGTTDGAEGQWHLYTGAWLASDLSRDDAIQFHDFESPDSRYGYRPWEYFAPSEEYNDVMAKLANTEFTNMDERGALFSQVFEWSPYFSPRIWIADALSYTPRLSNVSTSANLTAGVASDQMTTFTIGFNDKKGGDLVWGNSSPPLNSPVNPIAGTNWAYDSQYLNLTKDYPVIGNPFTGLNYPKRIEKADVVIEKGLPVGKTYDWVNLSFEDEIKVPEDAMIFFDIESETWKNANSDYFAEKLAKAQEAFEAAEAAVAEATEEDLENAQVVLESAKEDLEDAQATADKGYLTAKSKAVYYFEENLGDFTWHDGTSITLADIMMKMIMPFATGLEESPLYDQYASSDFMPITLPSFRGWRIVSESPIVIEYYDNGFALDAEQNVGILGLAPSWTHNSNGSQGSWSAVAAGNLVVLDGKAAWSEGASGESDTVEWLNYIDGPCKEYLKESYTKARDESYIPFEPTMGKYITKEEAKQAYQNTLDFFETNGHFHIGCGPYYVTDVQSVAGTITLSEYKDYKEDIHRWDFLTEPKIATVELDGPASVSTEAVFEVFVTDPHEEAYPISDINTVKYLVFDSNGDIADVVDLESEQDGLYTINLTAETIEKLGKGSCKLEVVVSPKAVAMPSIVSTEFIVE